MLDEISYSTPEHKEKTVTRITYENSIVREWLTGYFYDTAFSKKEKEYMFKKEIEYFNLQDYVYLLSLSEMNSYISYKGLEFVIGVAYATEYAIARGVRQDNYNYHNGLYYGRWLLRQDKKFAQEGKYVYTSSGSGYSCDGNPIKNSDGVRPAIIVDEKAFIN